VLLNDLYHFTNISSGAQPGDYLIEVSLNAGHKIFGGHFPEVPVMPGVCIMQMIADAASAVTAKPLQIKEGTDMKFTAIINPQEGTNLLINLHVNLLDSGAFKTDATITFNGQVSFKFKGILGE